MFTLPDHVVMSDVEASLPVHVTLPAYRATRTVRRSLKSRILSTLHVR